MSTDSAYVYPHVRMYVYLHCALWCIVIHLKRIRKVSQTEDCRDGTEAMLHLRAKRVNVGRGEGPTIRGLT